MTVGSLHFRFPLLLLISPVGAKHSIMIAFEQQCDYIKLLRPYV
jgi:hypothetical protein